MAQRRHARGRRREPARWLWLVPFVLVAAGGLTLLGGSLAVGATLEESDAFCASCHSQPELTYFTREQTRQPVDLATDHGINDQTRCIQCHSGSGVTGRLAALDTGANDLFHWVTGTAKQPAPLTQAIADANCLKCHAGVPNEQSFSTHFHVFLARWQAIDPKAATCVDCHSSHATDGQANLRFLNVPRTQAVCQHCHDAAGAGG